MEWVQKTVNNLKTIDFHILKNGSFDNILIISDKIVFFKKYCSRH